MFQEIDMLSFLLAVVISLETSSVLYDLTNDGPCAESSASCARWSNREAQTKK